MSVNIRQTGNHTWTQRSLGTAILQRRTELGLTQAALAERVATCGDWGFRQSDISHLERGIVTLPQFTRMRSLAAALDLPVGELLAKSGWTGAEEAFPSTERQPSGGEQAETEETGVTQADQLSRPSARSEEIQLLRQEIARLHEAVELLQETIASSSVFIPTEGNGKAP